MAKAKKRPEPQMLSMGHCQCIANKNISYLGDISALGNISDLNDIDDHDDQNFDDNENDD